MKRAVIYLVGAALCAMPLIAPAALAQSAKAAAYKAPRNALGQPDLTGYWTNASLTPENRQAVYGERLVHTPEEVAKLEGAVVEEVANGNKSSDPNAPAPKVGGEVAQGVRPEFAAAGGNVGGYDRGWLEPGSHVMRVNGEPRTSFLTTKNGRVPARKPNAPSSFNPNAGRGGGPFDNPEARSLGDRCLMSFGRNAVPPMLANGFYNNNYHFIQSRDAVAIVVEMVHDVRVIRLNSKHRTDDVRPWLGDSIGWWEGDTLVVETTHIPRVMAYNQSWENLKVTERFTRKSPSRLHYAYTIVDPDNWDAPFGGEYEFTPLVGQVMEYACHEGNYALDGILAGAREAERTAGRPAPVAAR